MTCVLGDKVIYEFKYGMEPIGTLKDGEKVTIESNDCFYQQVKNDDDVITEIDFGKINPATGPFYIEGAEIGDLVKVDILEIELEDQGATVVMPDGGLLGDRVKESISRISYIEDGMVDFLGIKAKVEPMVGVIGLSPGKDQEGLVTGVPGNHGGNMDTNDVKIGSSLYLPVREKGGLLALGDVHAIMGDGEICVSGLEIPAKVTIKVSLIKDRKLNWPVIETEEEIMVVASKETLEESSYEASLEMVNILEKALELDWSEAYMFASLFVDLRISQLVNPTKTVRAAVKKEFVDMEKFISVL